ncbi:MAG TPA: hypothetical protein ENI23_12335 [bacterium]|nr:hypothetical protein [bacterium]
MADVNNPPSGGFKEGGWYWNPKLGEAQHFSGGSFGAGSTLNVPGETGFGQRVSKEVQAQSGFVAQPKPRPQTKEEVTPFLQNFQTQAFDVANAPATKISTPAEIRAQLEPETGLPDLIKRGELRQGFRADLGVAGLEDESNILKAERREEEASLRERSTAQRGKGRPLNVVQGRIGEIERQSREKIDFIGRQQSRITDQLNTKYTLIGQMMSDAGLDYVDATERYETEYNQNLKVYELISGEKKEARSAFESDRIAAKANLQTYINVITEGNLDPSSLSGDQKLMISKLEAQSGLPIGFISNLKMSAQDKLISVNEKTGEALMMGSDGLFDVVQTGLRPTPTKETEGESKSFFTNSAKTDIENGVGLIKVLQIYSGEMDVNSLYKLYNINSPHGRANETVDELRPFGIDPKLVESDKSLGL